MDSGRFSLLFLHLICNMNENVTNQKGLTIKTKISIPSKKVISLPIVTPSWFEFCSTIKHHYHHQIINACTKVHIVRISNGTTLKLISFKQKTKNKFHFDIRKKQFVRFFYISKKYEPWKGVLINSFEIYSYFYEH